MKVWIESVLFTLAIILIKCFSKDILTSEDAKALLIMARESRYFSYLISLATDTLNSI
jgi:hypothetical protein